MGLEIVRISGGDLPLWEVPDVTEVFSGDLQDVSLNSLVQLTQAESISGWIRVHQRGEVSLIKGRITHAVCGELVGFEALRELMFLRDGRYSVIRGDPQETSPLDGVVYASMDAYRLREEWVKLSEMVLRTAGGQVWHSINHPLDRLAHEFNGHHSLAELVAGHQIEATMILDALLDAINIGLIEVAPRPEGDPAPALALVPAAREIDFLEAEDEDFDVLMERGRGYVRSGELDAAEDVFLRALAVRPDDRVAQQNLRAVARRREALRRGT